MLEIKLEAAAHVPQELPADYTAFMVVLEGDGLNEACLKSEQRRR